MRTKGGKVEKWNWQVKERGEGFLPLEDEKEVSQRDFDIAYELDKVDNELKGERATEKAARRVLDRERQNNVKSTPVKEHPQAMRTPSTSHT